MYQIAATLDIFKQQLSWDDIMSIELPLLSELYDARSKFMEDKRKIEEREMERAKQAQASAPRK
jgi:hypothetical protein